MTRAHPNLDNPKQASSQLVRQPATRKQMLPAKRKAALVAESSKRTAANNLTQYAATVTSRGCRPRK